MIIKKIVDGLLCGAVLVSAVSATAPAAETDTATTSHMGPGTEGTVKVNCENEYRDVSAGRLRTVTDSKAGRNHVITISGGVL